MQMGTLTVKVVPGGKGPIFLFDRPRRLQSITVSSPTAGEIWVLTANQATRAARNAGRLEEKLSPDERPTLGQQREMNFVELQEARGRLSGTVATALLPCVAYGQVPAGYTEKAPPHPLTAGTYAAIVVCEEGLADIATVSFTIA